MVYGEKYSIFSVPLNAGCRDRAWRGVKNIPTECWDSSAQGHEHGYQLGSSLNRPVNFKLRPWFVNPCTKEASFNSSSEATWLDVTYSEATWLDVTYSKATWLDVTYKTLGSPNLPHREPSSSPVQRQMLIREITGIYCKHHTKHINTTCATKCKFLHY